MASKAICSQEPSWVVRGSSCLAASSPDRDLQNKKSCSTTAVRAISPAHLLHFPLPSRPEPPHPSGKEIQLPQSSPFLGTLSSVLVPIVPDSQLRRQCPRLHNQTDEGSSSSSTPSFPTNSSFPWEKSCRSCRVSMTDGASSVDRPW